MRLTLPHTTIKDVFEDIEKGKRVVVLQLNEEDLFTALDTIKPSNIIKYLDMRGIQHREPSVVNINGDASGTSYSYHKKCARLAAEIERLKDLLKQHGIFTK